MKKASTNDKDLLFLLKELTKYLKDYKPVCIRDRIFKEYAEEATHNNIIYTDENNKEFHFTKKGKRKYNKLEME